MKDEEKEEDDLKKREKEERWGVGVEEGRGEKKRGRERGDEKER